MERYLIVDRSVIERSKEDQDSPQPGLDAELEAEGVELEVSHGGVGRPMNPGVLSPSVSAGIAAANALAAAGMPPEAARRLPRIDGEDGGHSLAEMAQRDLDAALQLLVYRAQYITGAGGAAIALRRDERNDMLCRASAGAKAPELGALLSTESGLSGESVRTRVPLRCDDTEHDPRVNQQSCRDLGIASVMIVPIMGEDLKGTDQVLGVFELFSGQAGAFAERDLSALQRLSEMVETAVRLAQAAQSVPREVAVLDLDPHAAERELERNEAGQGAQTSLDQSPENVAGNFLDDETVLEVELEEVSGELPREAVAEAAGMVMAAAPAITPVAPAVESTPAVLPAPIPSHAVAAAPAAVAAPAWVSVPAVSAPIPPTVVPLANEAAKRPLMWSAAAAVQANPETPKAVVDQSLVPPMLRNLRKCKACGFPVSEGRTLCVECDEKQWRGQPLPAARGRGAAPVVDFRQGGAANASGDARVDALRLNPGSSKVTGGGMPGAGIKVAPATAAVGWSSAAPIPAASGSSRPGTSTSSLPLTSSSSSTSTASLPLAPASSSMPGAPMPGAPMPGAPANNPPARVAPQGLTAALEELKEQEARKEAARRGATPAPVVVPAKAAEPPSVVPTATTAHEISARVASQAIESAGVRPSGEGSVAAVRAVDPNPASLNFTGGLGTSESWLGANKYILLAILVIAGVVAAIAWLR
ncbi:MAG TPA: GAF domain-containing protein [Candidatus Sulfotelmatobacter sp.]